MVGVNAVAFGGRSTCAHCDAHVSDGFRRVYGDSDDRAHRCPSCDSWRRLTEGSAAGLDVETPDPEQAPGRHGGEVA
ncbi:DUF7563 family protein [Halostella salina]|uniref:DUF7563 family protein n=1 Tax=Halostella salina TaxID=1547897 RepID=UPI000EF83CED